MSVTMNINSNIDTNIDTNIILNQYHKQKRRRRHLRFNCKEITDIKKLKNDVRKIVHVYTQNKQNTQTIDFDNVKTESLNMKKLAGISKFFLMSGCGYETVSKVFATVSEINKMNSQMKMLLLKNITNPTFLKGHIGEVLMAGTYNINAAKIGSIERMELTASNGLPTHAADFIFTKKGAKFPSLENFPRNKVGQLKIGKHASKSLLDPKNIEKYKGMKLYSSHATKISKNRICEYGIKSMKANNKRFIRISKSLIKNGHFKLLSTNKEVFKLVFRRANTVLLIGCALHAAYINYNSWSRGEQNAFRAIINTALDTFGVRDMYELCKVCGDICSKEVSYIVDLNSKLFGVNRVLSGLILSFNIPGPLFLVNPISIVHYKYLYLQHIKEQQDIFKDFAKSIKDNFNKEDYRYVCAALESYKMRRWYSKDEIPAQINEIKKWIEEEKSMDYELQFQMEHEELNELACGDINEYNEHISKLKERVYNGDEIAKSVLEINDIKLDSEFMRKMKNIGKNIGRHCKNVIIGYAGSLGERYHKTGELIKKEDIPKLAVSVVQGVVTEKSGEFVAEKFSSTFVKNFNKFQETNSVELADKIFGEDFLSKTNAEKEILITEKATKAEQVAKKATLRGKVAGAVCAGAIGFGIDISIRAWNKGITNLSVKDFKAAVVTGSKTGTSSLLLSLCINSADKLGKASLKAGVIGGVISIAEEGYNIYNTQDLKEHDLNKSTLTSATGSVVKTGVSSAIGYGLCALVGGPIGFVAAIGGSFVAHYGLSMADESMSNLCGQRRAYFLHCCKNLELSDNLDKNSFNRAVKKIKFKLHPDKVQNEEDKKKLTEKFQEIFEYISFYSIYKGWDSNNILTDEKEHKESFSNKVYNTLTSAFCKVYEVYKIIKQYEYFKEKDYYISDIMIYDVDTKLEKHESNAVLGNEILKKINKQIVITGCASKEEAVSSFSGDIENIEISKYEYNKPIRTIVLSDRRPELGPLSIMYIKLLDNVFLIGLNDDNYNLYTNEAKNYD